MWFWATFSYVPYLVHECTVTYTVYHVHIVPPKRKINDTNHETNVISRAAATYPASFIQFHANYTNIPIRVVKALLCTIYMVHEFLAKNKMYHIWYMWRWKCYAWFTFSSRVLVETFGEMWTRQGTYECRHSHSCAKVETFSFPVTRDWLTDMSRELRDETKTGWECGRLDKYTLHTLVLVLSHAVSMRM